MPKVHHVKKARKSNKAHGIKKGEPYFWWSTMSGGRGVKHYSLTQPKPSQLTNSEFWGTVYSLQEGAAANPPEFLEDVEGQRDEIVSELENLRDETQGKFDNMPEGLQQGGTGQLLEERVSALEDAISEIESVDCDSEVEQEEGQTDEEWAEAKETKKDEAWTQITDALDNISCS